MVNSKSILEKIMAYSTVTFFVGALNLNELSYERGEIDLKDMDRTYNVFARGDKIIFRDISSGPSIFYLDLIGDIKNGFQFARHQAPIRGVGYQRYYTSHINGKEFEDLYTTLLKKYLYE